MGTLGCGAAPSFVLVEGVNGKVDTTPVSVREVTVKQEFRNGKRVTVRYAALLIHEPKAKKIERHLLAEGDAVLISGVEYTVLNVVPGEADERATVTLQKTED